MSNVRLAALPVVAIATAASAGTAILDAKW